MIQEIINGQWKNFRAEQFTVAKRDAVIVFPEKALADNPCFWRARFFGAFPFADIAMLKAGYHLIHVDVTDLYGSPTAIAVWDEFYKVIIEKYGIHPRVNIEGMSRGGLISLNWAIANPEKINTIYIDNPVCDFKSWPGGFGAGPGSCDDWAKCLKAYGFANDEEAKAYTGNPLDSAKQLAEAGVPLLIVYGDADEVVPVAENCLPLIEQYKKFGGKVFSIKKAGGLHHPHCLENPQPIVDFITTGTLPQQ